MAKRLNPLRLSSIAIFFSVVLIFDTFAGTFAAEGFELLVGAHNQALETISTVESSSRLVDTQRQGTTESTENELAEQHTSK